ncbi:MAG: tetratricopeptide repeat protein, partial [Nitrospirae bacterium]|nr:tetratricopeptide repeat protein [Nitrospirota bacterium]
MNASIANSYNPVNTIIIAKAYSDDRKGVADSLLVADEKTLFDRGLKAAEEGKDREAIDLLTRVISINSWNADAYAIRVQIFQRISQYQEALKDYDSLIKLVKDSKALGQIYGMRGDLFKSLRQFPPAIADFTKAIEMNPDDLQALFLRGNSHYLAGRSDDA